MKKLLKQAEDKLANLFKDAPKLSDSARESLVKAWPWIALVVGILQLLAAWGLYKLTDWADRSYRAADSLYRYYTGEGLGAYSGFDKLMIYLAVVVLVVDAVILLMAFSPLKERRRKGWDLLFLGVLVNLLYGLVSVFIDTRGIGSLLFSLLGSAVGFWLLFQVRDKFAKK